MDHEDPRDPNVPPRVDSADVEEKIDPENEVDEAAFESFPASDPPAFASKPASSVGPGDYPGDEGEEEGE